MKKCIVLCADDYGQAPAISQGIINLIKIKRLSATSCMVNSLYWQDHAQWLIPFQQQIDIGLHFNLTHGEALSTEYRKVYGHKFFSLSKVIGRAYLRLLSQSVIEAECHAQIDRFEQALGCLPSYIDGHQHVHQFPVIREAILRVYEARLRSQDAYIRLVNESLTLSNVIYQPKKWIIRALGMASLRRLLDKNKIPYNQSFAGVYAFASAKSYAKQFPYFLYVIGNKGLIMCHPGLVDYKAQDGIANARYVEYEYLSSDKFLKDCEACEVTLARFSR